MSSATVKSWLTKLPLLCFVALYFGHMWVIYQNSVNVPFWDEWVLLRPRGLPSGLSWWVFEQANEHRIIPTNLLTLLLLYTTGWNHVVSMLVTYALYGVLLAALYVFARKTVPHLPAWVVFAFLAFLLSPINWENHFWGFESSYHFAMLFSLLAAYFLFAGPQTGKRLASGAALAVLATYSFFSGLAVVLVLVALFGLFKICRGGRREYLQLAAVALPVLGLMSLYFINYRRVGHHPPAALPHTASFWKFFTNLVSWGFGFETDSVVLGAVCLLVVLAPLALEVWEKGWRLPASSWAVYAFTLGVLCALAAISVGRANGSGRAKISRYSDFAMMLVPCAVMVWAIFLKDRPAPRRYVLAALWVFCFVGFSYKWLWFPIYREQADRRREGIRCIQTYYASGGDAVCRTLYTRPLAPMLEEGKRMNLSFYRELQEAGESERR